MGFIYRALVRPAIFQLPPELSHGAAETFLRFRPAWSLAGRLLAARDRALAVRVAGMSFPNPIGMAAGFDKDCRVLGSLLDIGFGFAVGGTVTLEPQSGNPRPRLVRDSRRGALVNSLGFPGKGLERAELELKRLSKKDRRRVIVSVSGTEEDDIAECYERLAPLAAAIEVNISSPNTAGLVIFQEPERLRELIQGLARLNDNPCFVKLPRLEDSEAVTALAVAAVEAGAEGVVVANTLPIAHDGLAVGRGGLSGKPLFESTLAAVGKVRAALPEAATVIACGGVSTAAEARRLLDAGAAAIQLYTAFIYEGPGLPGEIARGLAGH